MDINNMSNTAETWITANGSHDAETVERILADNTDAELVAECMSEWHDKQVDDYRDEDELAQERAEVLEELESQFAAFRETRPDLEG
jgi:hypothetical protein